MIDHANELRHHARKIPHPQGETPGVMLRAADEIECLRAKIEQMERQEPIGWFARIDGDGPLMECKHADLPRVPLYARVGAQAAPEAKP